MQHKEFADASCSGGAQQQLIEHQTLEKQKRTHPENLLLFLREEPVVAVLDLR